MREIKFRALFLKINERKKPLREYMWVYYEAQQKPQAPAKFPFIVESDLQYTGQKDKNGKEIYEGDVIGVRYLRRNPRTLEQIPYSGIAVIKYCPEAAAYQLAVINSAVVVSMDRVFELTVVGNIYEHPHLLETPKAIVTTE